MTVIVACLPRIWFIILSSPADVGFLRCCDCRGRAVGVYCCLLSCQSGEEGPFTGKEEVPQGQDLRRRLCENSCGDSDGYGHLWTVDSREQGSCGECALYVLNFILSGNDYELQMFSHLLSS